MPLGEKLYRYGCILVGSFKLSSGGLSPYYIDLRRALAHPQLYREIVGMLVEKARSIPHDVVAGVATGGIPWASMIAYEMGKPLAYVRSERKSHGTSRLVEGVVEGRQVLVVDDVATTGSSLARAIKAIRDHGGKPVAALVIVDRCQGARERLRELGVELYSLTTAHELVEELYSLGLISDKAYSLIKSYLESGR